MQEAIDAVQARLTEKKKEQEAADMPPTPPWRKSTRFSEMALSSRCSNNSYRDCSQSWTDIIACAKRSCTCVESHDVVDQSWIGSLDLINVHVSVCNDYLKHVRGRASALRARRIKCVVRSPWEAPPPADRIQVGVLRPVHAVLTIIFQRAQWKHVQYI